jgi:hypothetical protein
LLAVNRLLATLLTTFSRASDRQRQGLIRLQHSAAARRRHLGRHGLFLSSTARGTNASSSSCPARFSTVVSLRVGAEAVDGLHCAGAHTRPHQRATLRCVNAARRRRGRLGATWPDEPGASIKPAGHLTDCLIPPRGCLVGLALDNNPLPPWPAGPFQGRSPTRLKYEPSIAKNR